MQARKRKFTAGKGSSRPQQRLRAALAAVAPPAAVSRRFSKESGYVDLASASYGFNTTGSVTLLATIPQNSTVNGRVGKKAMLKSLQCRGSFNAGSTGTIADAALLVVYDKRPTGALPAITAILESANSAAMNNDVNSGRFKILKRWDFVATGNSAAPSTGLEMQTADFFLKLNRLIVFKAATTGAIDDIEEGALYLVTVGSNGAGTTAINGTLAFRTRFVDF